MNGRFFAGDKNTEKKPIFPSLNKNNEQTDGDQLSEEATLPSAPQPGPMFVSIERIDLPTPPTIPSTLEIPGGRSRYRSRSKWRCRE
jgi:hypothetical protein